MQCEDVEQALELEGLEPLPEAARLHVAGCRRCQGFIADLDAIVSAANELPAEVHPPARVWISLRNQLETEGIIRPEAVPREERSSWWHGFGHLLRSRALATVTVGILIAVAAVVQLQHRNGIQTSFNGDLPPSIEQTRKIVNDQEIDLRNMHLTSNSPVDASLQQNLQQLNDFIADCERHLKASPQDELAREYLYSAYEQKAELLAAMMDRGRSVN